MNINLRLSKKKEILIARFLLALFIMQFMFALPIYADSKASVELVLKSEGNAVSGGKIKVMEQGVTPLSFIRENGIYKADSSGFYKEITTGSKGEAIISGLDVGVYTALYLENGRTKSVVNFNINSKSDFKQIDFNVGADNNNSNSNTDNSNNTNNSNNTSTSIADTKLKFHSTNVKYRVEDSNGNKLKFKKNGNGNYSLGGDLDFIESQNNVTLKGLKKGKYYVIGQGKKYTINVGDGDNKFLIPDNHVVEEVVEEVIETGSLNISIKNKKTKDRYEDVYIKILNRNNRPLRVKELGIGQYIYDESGDITELKYDGRNIKILGVPVGEYTVVDISNDGIEFDDTKVNIKEDKTAMVNIEKAPLENDLNLNIELDTESDIKLKDDDIFVFNLEDTEGNLLYFEEDEDGVYSFDEDGEKDIEVNIDGVDILDIPGKEVVVHLKKAPKGFEDELKEIKIDLMENEEYAFIVELLKYSLELINEENNPIPDVLISILDKKEKEVSKATSDKEGVLNFEGLEEDEEYKLKVLSVPSPYALPNQGELIDIEIEDKEIKIGSIDNSPVLISDEETNKDKNDKDEDESELKDDKELELAKEFNGLKIPFAEFIATTSSGKEGSIFSFVDKDGEEVYRLISEEDGKVSINKIDHGEYVVTQLTVADGYKISEDKYKLVVDENYVSQEYVFDNPKIGAGENDIQRDDKKDRTMAVVLIILVLFFAFINLYISNERYKEKHGKNKYKIFDKIDELTGGDEEFETLSEDELESFENEEGVDIEEQDKKPTEEQIGAKNKSKKHEELTKEKNKKKKEGGNTKKKESKEKDVILGNSKEIDDKTMVLNMKDIEGKKKK